MTAVDRERVVAPSTGYGDLLQGRDLNSPSRHRMAAIDGDVEHRRIIGVASDLDRVVAVAPDDLNLGVGRNKFGGDCPRAPAKRSRNEKIVSGVVRTSVFILEIQNGDVGKVGTNLRPGRIRRLGVERPVDTADAA